MWEKSSLGCVLSRDFHFCIVATGHYPLLFWLSAVDHRVPLLQKTGFTPCFLSWSCRTLPSQYIHWSKHLLDRLSWQSAYTNHHEAVTSITSLAQVTICIRVGSCMCQALGFQGCIICGLSLHIHSLQQKRQMFKLTAPFTSLFLSSYMLFLRRTLCLKMAPPLPHHWGQAKIESPFTICWGDGSASWVVGSLFP